MALITINIQNKMLKNNLTILEIKLIRGYLVRTILTSLYQQVFIVHNNRFTDIQFIRWKIGNYCIAVKRLLWTITSC